MVCNLILKPDTSSKFPQNFLRKNSFKPRILLEFMGNGTARLGTVSQPAN